MGPAKAMGLLLNREASLISFFCCLSLQGFALSNQPEERKWATIEGKPS